MLIEISEESAETLYRILRNLTTNEFLVEAEDKAIPGEKLIKATDEWYEALDKVVGKNRKKS